MKTITLLIKIVSLASAGAAYTDIIPAKFLPVAALVFASASTLKDLFIKIGDWLDDKQINGSFKP